MVEEKHTSVTKIRTPQGRLENNRVCFSYHGYDITLPTMALYQTKNASLAIRVSDFLRKSHLIELNRSDIVSGLQNTSWAGRFEIINEQPLIIVDGAHNEHGISAVTDSIRNLKHPLCIIASILSDKQYDKMIKKLNDLADELIITTFNSSRSTPLQQLVGNNDVTAICDYRQALEYATDRYGDGTILITGSLYFVSEIRSLYKGDK